MLNTLLALNDAHTTDTLDKVITHIGEGSISVHSTFVLHFKNAVLYKLKLVIVKLKHFNKVAVVFYKLCCTKPRRDAEFDSVVLYLVGNAVNASVHRPLRTEIGYLWKYFLLSHVDSVRNKLAYSLVFSSTDWNYRDAEHFGDALDIYRTAVISHFIHHIQRYYHRNMHFKQLKGKIEVSFNIRGIDDVYYAIGLFIYDKIPGNDLLLCIWS